MLLSNFGVFNVLDCPCMPGQSATNMLPGLTNTVISANAESNWRNARFEPAERELIDTWPKGTSTNGLFCALSFGAAYTNGLPVFYANIINTTTNFIHGFVGLSPHASLNLALFDPDGKLVGKTLEGQQTGTATEAEISDWFEKDIVGGRDGHIRGRAPVNTLFPASWQQIGNAINVTQLFHQTRPGEHELHVRIRVAFSSSDANGKTTLNMFWMPEVVAKVLVPPNAVAKAGN